MTKPKSKVAEKPVTVDLDQLTEGQRALVEGLLRNRVWQLKLLVEESKNLSQPVTPGRWRWADVKAGGHGHKSEEELAADRARAAERLVRFTEELDDARVALMVITGGGG